jgi:hypothetical protein
MPVREMPMSTVAGLFEDHPAAEAAIERLRAAGVEMEDLSLLGRDGAEQDGASGTEDETAVDPAVVGAGVLGGLGGLALGLGSVAALGVGLLAAGPIAVVLGGARLAQADHLVHSIADLGVAEDTAHTYAAEIERGRWMVGVRTDDPDTIQQLLEAGGAPHVHG